MKRNLLTITMLALCLVIGITLVAVPASAQFICEGTDQLQLEEGIIEFSVKCEGERIWGLEVYGGIYGPGELELYFLVCDIDDSGYCSTIAEESGTFSSNLSKRDIEFVMDNGDSLMIEFKFIQPE